jgi:PPOX class probable F420-dependent enzyme
VTTLGAEEASRRFAQGRVARMSTVRPDGRPHLVPIVFAVDGDTIYSGVDEKPKRSPELQRLQNIHANPNVVLLVDHYDDDWEAVWWTRADGTASVHEDGPERSRAVELLTAKYRQYEDGTEPIGAAVAIRVSKWSGWAYT